MNVEHTQGQWIPQLQQQQKQMQPAEESTGTGETESVESGQGSEGASGYSQFLQEILKDAPKEHLQIVEPYMKKFDAGSTRRFQDLQNQYKHYSNLGWDEDTTQQMAEIYRVLNEEPETLFEALKSELGIGSEEQNGQSTGEIQSAQEFQGLPPEIQQRIDQQEQILQALATIVMEGQTKQQYAAEDSEFESYLGLLKQEYGEFDEQYVTMAIANGLDGEAAVKQYNAMVQEVLQKANSATDGLPNALLSSSGGGAVPQEKQQNLGQIPQADIKNLIANVIGQANQSGQ